MLQDTIAKELHEAMAAKNELRLSVFRLLSAAIHNREISERTKRRAGVALSDEEILQVVRGEMKKRNDAVEAYAAGGRHEAAAREREEAAVLALLLPPELSDAELAVFVEEGMRALGASSEAPSFGKLMGWLKGRVLGRASGERVLAAARKRLADA
ncbi:MAG: hypothetical protein A3B37_03270 [Candidatus Sungbacteria bacterium RIFCSPLOWO2_01_FULL_59_16]|uniref:Glutamyl-tRNA amidotransferase n=1 Tax=Candidatus Sungbacteria bacterium RIFCSPLOWO2_01_FULL_59_16 TaxID=1802280 RepID=A0A1G2L9A9_9BACT|nr:MAG: hypothetical protein A3B37_03270 [Candidatus Sungbacteria bacterium RIFCSPLOWO2_01_FULL_59_16]